MTVAEGYKNVNFFFHHECLQMNLDEGETIFLNRQANFFDIVGKVIKKRQLKLNLFLDLMEFTLQCERK